MALIDWNPAMDIGVEQIDREHRELVALMNRLYEKWLSGELSGEVKDGLKELHHYAKNHLVNEEQLMTDAGFPELEKHKMEHAGFSEKVHVIAAGIQSGTSRPDELLHFLSDWLTEHILSSDQAFARYLRSVR